MAGRSSLDSVNLRSPPAPAVMRLTQMATLATPLLQRSKEPDDEQLLKLFWNRAELKKELARLRRDREKLVEQVRQEENARLRTQQRLEQLEQFLADPVQAASAAVYYQLRGVWNLCRRQVQQIAGEFEARQREREEQHARSVFQRRKEDDLSVLDEKLALLLHKSRAVQAEEQGVRERIARMRGFWNYFRRRRLAEQVETIGAARDGIDAQVVGLEADRREKDREQMQPLGELSLEGKRNINLVVIAMAQEMLAGLAQDNIALLAREASIRAFTEVAYGGVSECRELSRRIEIALRRLGPADQLRAPVRRRAEGLRSSVRYRKDNDTVPASAGLARISVPMPAEGAGQTTNSDRVIAVNVVSDEFWDIQEVLLK